MTQRYKQTKVGVIPEEWSVKRLGEIGDVVRGSSPRPAGDSRFFGGDFMPWLTVASLTNTSEYVIDITETVGYLTEDGSRQSRTLPADTLIIANSGATLGVAKILKNTSCANDGIAAIVNQRLGDKRYICHYINTLTKTLREVVATGNGQPNLNTGLIRGIVVPLPSYEEQIAISTAIDDVDALLCGLDRLIAKKRDLKQAAMQQLLTGQTRLPGFQGKWVLRRLGEIGRFFKGRGVTKDQAQSGSLACIRYGELYTLHNDVIRTYQSWISPDVATTATRLKPGDILFAGSGETKEEIGKCVAFVGGIEVYAGGDIVILRPNDHDSFFLGYYLNTGFVARQKSSRGQGDAVVHISSTALADIQCMLPTLEEQTAIAAVLSDIDAELTALEARRNKIRNLKQAMMQELLTGKTRLV